MEKQINSETLKLNLLRQEILEKEKLKSTFSKELEVLANFKVLDINQLRFLNEYQNFLRRKISEIDLFLENLKEEEKKLIESIKEKNMEKKATHNYIHKKLFLQEVKKQFEENIQNTDTYNRNFNNRIF
jgi:hypothetical protein